ncbi:hypothetical protein BGX23_003567 [Mortierella sp. AD031]|nr:hypothetical protein BGX23_003567 [Mortierella sp. AD031]
MSALRFMLYIEELINQGQLDLVEEDEVMDGEEEDMEQEEQEEQEEEEEEQEEEGGEEGEEQGQILEQEQENPPPLFNGWFDRGERFNLRIMNEQQAWEQLRFRRQDILSVVEALRLPDPLPTNSGDNTRVPSEPTYDF